MQEEIFSAIAQLHVVVIGDVMIDRYYSGKIDRVSPEAPVPLVNVKATEDRLGGAANVALNCKAMGAKVSLASVIGDDADAAILLQLLEENEIEHALVFKSDQRKTTCKTRVLSRNQQILRFDQEMETDLELKEEHHFIDMVLRFLQIQKPDIVIFQDYNKGVLKENIINRITQHCKNLDILIAVDPKKKNFFAYKNVAIFKPNLKELREGLHLPIDPVNLANLEEAHQLLKDKLGHKISFITLSEHGVFYQNEDDRKIIPSHHRNISDVSGAGDSVIAVAALVYAVTKNANLMAEYSNIAGGLVCEEVGVVPINKEKLQSEIKKLEQ